MDMPFPPTPPENVTNGQLYAAIMAVAAKQNEQAQKHEHTNERLTELSDNFEQYKRDHKEMVETWTTAKGTMKFIRFLAMIGLPIGALTALIAGVLNRGT